MANHVILNNIEHQDIRVIRDRSAEFGDNVMGVPIMPREFRDAQADFPIFFHKESPDGKFQPYAMFGLLLGSPDDHLTTTLRVFLDADSEVVTLVDADVVPHVLWNRDPTTDTDSDVAVVERAVNGHAASSLFVL